MPIDAASERPKCPECGAESDWRFRDGRLYGFVFQCGSRMDPAKISERKITRQADACRIRELESQNASLTARVGLLEQFVGQVRDSVGRVDKGVRFRAHQLVSLPCGCGPMEACEKCDVGAGASCGDYDAAQPAEPQKGDG